MCQIIKSELILFNILIFMTRYEGIKQIAPWIGYCMIFVYFR